jgi:hypothetical protein
VDYSAAMDLVMMIASILFCCGVFMLHFRLRSKWSLFFLISFGFTILWIWKGSESIIWYQQTFVETRSSKVSEKCDQHPSSASCAAEAFNRMTPIIRWDELILISGIFLISLSFAGTAFTANRSPKRAKNSF